MRINEVGELASQFGRKSARLEPFIRCYVPRVEQSGTRMQCGSERSGESRAEAGVNQSENPAVLLEFLRINHIQQQVSK